MEIHLAITAMTSMLMYTPTLCVSSLWSHLIYPQGTRECQWRRHNFQWEALLELPSPVSATMKMKHRMNHQTSETTMLHQSSPDPNHFSLLCPKKITTKTAVPLPKMHHQNPTPINLHLLRSTIIPQMWLWNHHRCTIFCFKVIIQSPNGRHGEGLSGSRHATELIIIVEGLWCFTRLNVDHLKPWIHGQQDPHYPVWVGLLKCHLYIVLALK